MSNEELLLKWERLVERVGYEIALSMLIETKKVSIWTAENLSGMQYKSKKPSRRTREALLMCVSKVA